jgi:hypothetical protein
VGVKVRDMEIGYERGDHKKGNKYCKKGRGMSTPSRLG